MDVASIYQNVQTRYSEIALQAHGDEAQLSKASRIASSFGYSGEDLASLPSGTNLGVSCGNPLATVNLEPSETVQPGSAFKGMSDLSLSFRSLY
ncbi:hypothetical protein LTR43_012456 [Exophiala xenobiotica]|nr:hypothetical protein LTR43_012456 [Exophiala xenobiotica]